MTTDEMVARYLAGDTMKAIGAAAGISRQAVEQRLRPAKADGTIPAGLTERRRAAATSVRGKAENGLCKARAARWAVHGYTDEFKALVAASAAQHGVAHASREWRVSEVSARAWRDKLAGPRGCGPSTIVRDLRLHPGRDLLHRCDLACRARRRGGGSRPGPP